MRDRLLEIDTNLTGRLQIAERPGIARSLAAILAHTGDSWFWVAGLFFLSWKGTPFWQSRALFMLIWVIVAAGLVLLIKFTTRRSRPKGEWGGIYRNADPHSFPSGHATRAFLLAALAFRLGPPWLAAVLMVWAPFVSLARVFMGVHYLSDILAGGLLGILIGLFSAFVY